MQDKGKNSSAVARDLPEPDRVKAATGGAVWTAGATSVQMVLQILALVVFARLLSPSDFGIVSACLVFIALAQTVSVSGIGPVIVQRPELTSDHIQCANSLSLVCGSLFALFTLAAAPLIASVFDIEEMVNPLRVISIGFLLQSVGVIAEHLLVRELKLKKLALIELMSYGCGYLAVGLGLALKGFGYWSLIIAHLAQVAIKNIGVFVARPHSLRPAISSSKFREMGFVGAGFSLSRLLNFTANNIDNVVVARYLGADALGLYSRAYQLMVVPARIYAQVADRVMFPFMARANEQAQLGRSHLTAIATSAAIGLPASVLLAWCANDLVILLFGQRWLAIVPPFQVLALAIYFRVGQKAAGTVLRATGAVVASAWVQGAYALSVGLGAGLGSLSGLTGVALGVAIAVTIHYAISNLVALRYSGLTMRQLIGAHRLGLAQSVLIGVTCFAVHLLVRQSEQPLVRLLVTVITAILASGLAAKMYPSVFFDTWLSSMLTSLSRKRTTQVVDETQ